MDKENKSKDESEELCCADKSVCDIICAPKKDGTKSECVCGGKCGCK